MDATTRQLEDIGLDVISPVERDGQFHFRSRALDRLGPSQVNKMLFDAFDEGKLDRSPFEIIVSTAA